MTDFKSVVFTIFTMVATDFNTNYISTNGFRTCEYDDFEDVYI